MTLSTFTAAVAITPVVLGTFARHFQRKVKKKNIRDEDDTEAVDDLLFDQAFHIVKAFLQLATRNTVEELQAYTNTYVPPPYWAEIVPAMIPLSCCNKAADHLISWFDPNELKNLVGGERWWQVRGIDGIQAEWVAMKSDWSKLRRAEKLKKTTAEGKNKEKEAEHLSRRLDNLQNVLLYIPGGGFYFGSINTHRYQIIRLARKIGGRAFAVNYRKAPQYPWPCPLVDVLAAYLFLIQPPKGASHTAISPDNIVIAGDSAGGSLCLSLLIVLRDLGLPLPAGAVLISPWVDLTHSFPSVMENTERDIIPEHGFIHKPSTLWPPPVVPASASNVGGSSTSKSDPPSSSSPLPLQDTTNLDGQAEAPKDGKEVTPDSQSAPQSPFPRREPDAQIQLYATNEQLTHPLASPLFSGSLGGLCPLYILGGNFEVLRDEIVYLAHRAAYPEKYRLREGLMNYSRQRESAKAFTQGTSVHFQLFDDMCHVLTVFSFTTSATYAYRGVSRFVKRVIDQAVQDGTSASEPFPGSDLGNVSKESSSSSEALPATSASQQPGVVKQDYAVPEGGQTAGQDIEGTRLPTPEIECLVQQEPLQTIITQTILCERVDIHGKVRPMEPEADIDILKTAVEDIGVFKDAPLERWFAGQKATVEKNKNRMGRISKEREKYRARAVKIISEAGTREQPQEPEPAQPIDKPEGDAEGEIFDDGEDHSRRWGPLDLDEENPPPSAIAKRRDTPDAIALLKTALTRPPPSIRPTTSRALPPHPLRVHAKRMMHPRTVPKPMVQSASEVQRHSNKIPGSHGVRLWSGIMASFVQTSKSGKKGTARAKEALTTTAPAS